VVHDPCDVHLGGGVGLMSFGGRQSAVVGPPVKTTAGDSLMPLRFV